ncbi:branched-chain amino acid transport system II carrier protein [Eikenella sp. Marseille-P7795]|uniref:branched-chain amino acid transport system II carrier protein n=1 Tax=Eikenella sp. Marseille-P7795 TaxID=2866577 RepID=UPI001CE42F19|nr:branched-chain amino acid transport system II carrier protein [Eikenella sp. Marseille-P7795]
MNKNTFVIGFMLFAIFFGAGNLIFPPTLGLNSGPEFWRTLAGFVITGVGLPLLGIVVSAFYQNGYKTALNRIHPWFSVLFLMAIYLTIGPFFAIPRTGATSYEMAILPFIGEAGAGSLLAFTVVYYALTLWLSLNPSKMVERIGAILTPALLVSILALIGKSMWWLFGSAPTLHTVNFGGQSAFLSGFIGGYQTMDVLASVAFSVIVINAIKAKMPAGQRDNKIVVKQTFVAGIIAAASLAVIYVGLAWVCNRLPVPEQTLTDLAAKNQDIGSFLLTTAAYETFGSFGRILFGTIVTLACLTTSVGLVTAVGEFFYGLFPRISYRAYVVSLTLVSFILANQGLSTVISKSVPVLMVLYPIAMTILLLLLIDNFVRPLPVLSHRLAAGLVTIISILSVAGAEFIKQLPLQAFSLEWLPFALAGILIGCAGGLAGKPAADSERPDANA